MCPAVSLNVVPLTISALSIAQLNNTRTSVINALVDPSFFF